MDTLAIVRAHAQRVLDYKDAADRDVTQSSVDVATRQLMNAVNALVALPGEEKPEPPEQPVNPGTVIPRLTPARTTTRRTIVTSAPRPQLKVQRLM